MKVYFFKLHYQKVHLQPTGNVGCHNILSENTGHVTLRTNYSNKKNTNG